MCITAAGIAGAASIAGTAGSFAGKLLAGQAQGEAAAYQSAVARNAAMIAKDNAQTLRYNADLAEAYGTRALVAGTNQVQAKGMEVGARLGKIKAGQAAAGVDVNTGSAVDVRAGTREMGRLDEETIMSNTQWENYGFRTRAQDLRHQADLAENQATLDYATGQMYANQGEYAKQGAALGALGTLAGNASSLPWKWVGIT